jgi:hypothetical protein
MGIKGEDEEERARIEIYEMSIEGFIRPTSNQQNNTAR